MSFKESLGTDNPIIGPIDVSMTLTLSAPKRRTKSSCISLKYASFPVIAPI